MSALTTELRLMADQYGFNGKARVLEAADKIEELERDLAAMQASRDYEKTAHARSTKTLRDMLAEAKGTTRQPGWEDDWLAKVEPQPAP